MISILKKPYIFIVIAFVVGFQQTMPGRYSACAATVLPILKFENTFKSNNTNQVQLAEKLVEQAGYRPLVVLPENLLSLHGTTDFSVVLCPLPPGMSTDMSKTLSRYLDHGGKLVLTLPNKPLTSSGIAVLQALHIPVVSTTSSPNPIPLYWAGQNLRLFTQLPAQSSIVEIKPNPHAQVIAYWGKSVPAIVKTENVVLLNWSWGNVLSSAVNQLAFVKALSQLSPSRPALAETTQPAAKHVSSLTSKKTEDIAPSKTVTLSETVLQLKPDPSLQENIKQDVYKASHPLKETHNPLATEDVKSPSLSQKADLVDAKEKKLPTAVTEDSLPESTLARASVEEQDSEVLDTILGTSQNNVPENASPESPTVDTTAAPSPKKPFSFLDPEVAAEVLKPKFDYGLYTMYLRLLEDYMAKVKHNLQTYSILGFSMPAEEVNALLRKTQEAKRLFQSTYIQGETQKGLDAFEEGYRYVIKAMSLTQISSPLEARAIWLDRGTIVDAKNAEGLKKQIQKLHASGINLIYFETINAGFPIYPSRITEQNPLIQGWDPLQVATEEAHRLGIELHAWVWAFAVGNQRHNKLIGKDETYPGPILAAHPELLSETLKDKTGSFIPNGQHEYWLSPASPVARQFLIRLYSEIVSHYNVDGLHLDYIRYPFQKADTQMGYEDVGRYAFQQATGQDLSQLNSDSNKLWLAWKTVQVNSFVRDVSSAVRAINPKTILSAAVFPMSRTSRIVSIQQDWETWVENGWVDILNPMVYTRSPQRLQQMVRQLQQSPTMSPLLYPGIAMHRLDDSRLLLELEALQQQGSLGNTLFASAYLDQKKADVLSLGLYKQSSKQPLPHQDPGAGLVELLHFFQQHFIALDSIPYRKNSHPDSSDFNQKKNILSALKTVQASLTTIQKNRLMVTSSELQTLDEQLSLLKQYTQYWVSQAPPTEKDVTLFFQETLGKIENLLHYWQGKVLIAQKGKSTSTAQAK